MENLEFIKKDNNIVLSYHILHQKDGEIGSIEGFVNIHGQLITKIKISNDEYRNKGIGFTAFSLLFDDLNKKTPIVTIMGGWNKNDDYRDCENGMSTNLKVFKEKIQSGISPKEAAMLTPTGKWAQKLGYTEVEIRFQSNDNVEVSFHKS